MPKLRWYKGNIHTHTTESDGDAEPHKVVSWYRRHGYDFLVLSDHNHLTVLDYAGRRRFKRPLMVRGEEVSANIQVGEVPIHINGIGLSRVVEPIDADGIVETIQANVNAILGAGGIASINHPNFHWAFTDEHIKQVVGASLLEVFNGVNLNNIYGAPGRPSAEEIWDGVLTAGRVIYGVATDDSHHYHDFHPGMANPGRGWVVVRAAELSEEAVVEALASGNFYASTGVDISELEVSKDAISLRIEQEWSQVFGNVREWDQVYTTEFIGRGGRKLDEQTGQEPSYRISGDEGYVRARVTGSSGVRAWTQPVFLGA